ncbi:hypothetical protein B0J13DRAFT_555340 [Dactylonectria estremocensis]|uniref:Secreted protein n=1 Tax=Dactylonectria estremocensis TaxID=1079267 RepID=A0A9P9J321_9HYPO|nr:hypothetical protein B0J13DRAFT_555340 [Dactylonectria estremocensis]
MVCIIARCGPLLLSFVLPVLNSCSDKSPHLLSGGNSYIFRARIARAHVAHHDDQHEHSYQSAWYRLPFPRKDP